MDDKPENQGRRYMLETKREQGVLDYVYSYLVSSDIKKVAIGGLLNYAAFLIIPIFIFNGFIYKITRFSALSEEPEPDYNDLGHLVKKGLGYSVVSFIPFVIILLPAITLDFIIGSNAISILAVILSFFVVSYIAPAINTVYAVKGSIGDLASSYTEIISFALSKEYLLYYALYIGLQFGIMIAFMLGFFVLAFTIIGLLAIPFVAPIVSVVIAYGTGAYWGEIYRRHSS